MRETSYHAVIAEMTVRALWELQNLLDCIPDDNGGAENHADERGGGWIDACAAA